MPYKVTGVIASVMVFPLAILLSFLFKQSRSLNSYVWPSRPPTGIVVPMEVEIPIHSNAAFSSEEKIKSDDSGGSSGFWTLTSGGISGTSSSRIAGGRLRRGSKLVGSLDSKSFTTSSSTSQETEKNDFGESNLCVIQEENTPKLRKLNSSKSVASTKSTDSGLSNKSENSNDVELNEIPIVSLTENGDSSSIEKFDLNNFGQATTSDQTTNECLLPHYTIKLTFILSWLIIIVSCIFVRGHKLSNPNSIFDLTF